MNPKLLLLLLFTISGTHCLFAQTEEPGDAFSFPGKILNGIQKRTSRLHDQLSSQTEKYLRRLERQEAKMQKKLYKIDSTASKNLFADASARYAALAQKLQNNNGIAGSPGGEYLPYLDSLKGSLAFLEKSNLGGYAGPEQEKIAAAIGSVNNLQSSLHNADEIKAFVQQRKQQIKDALSRYTQLPNGLKNSFSAYNSETHYYAEQVREYKDIFNNPDKLEATTLSLLNRLPAFQQFMQQHSELAGMFSLPGTYGAVQNLAGLQTREQVMQTVTSLGGPNANQLFQQQVNTAQGQLDQFKDKLLKLGSGSGDMDMPDFKTNNQKTKTFLKRIEYGTNIQTVNSSYYFPSTTDIALSAGYKLNTKNTIGIGASYKMGWGKDIRHIALSAEGVGLRSFIDLALKGSFYASGGLEYNYQQPYYSLREVYNLRSWQQSGLLGISKIVAMKSKLFKNTKLQLLWDFLSYQQRPVTQPFKFRVGYNF